MSELVDLTRLTTQAQRLLEAARAAGADAADAVVLRSVNQVASVLAGKVEKIDHAENDEFGLRVFVGECKATISSTAGADVDEIAGRAVAMARAATPDRFAGLADAARLSDAARIAAMTTAIDVLDPTEVATDTIVERALVMEAAARAVAGVTNISGASAYWARGGMALVTSDGFSGAYESSGHGHSISAIAGTGTGMERDWDSSSKTHVGDLDTPETVGRRAGERAVARLQPRQVDTTTATVVYDRRVATSLIGALTGAIAGTSIARRSSFLKDRLGSRVFAPGIRITDDPLRRRGSSSRPFDGEGVSSEPIDLVADGVLTSWILDSASARELGLQTNGRAGRGVSSVGPAATNVLLHPGDIGRDALIAEVGTGFLVTDFIGHGANLVTGDYSRGASGFWIENGEIAYPVAGVTVAGNLVDMFARLRPADDIEYRGAFTAPTLAIEGLTVAGR